ncbi:MAG: DUF1329 domain-containing protein [Oleiphilus sp.]|nr:MAG: DUF1329 domain-containing protein [Oleiphilus sp.]
MNLIKTICAMGVISAVCGAGTAMAKVSAEEAAKLGNELTPIGAEKAGNAAGTIPAWDGGLKEIPAGFKSGEPYIDPFAGEKPLFTITKENMAQYADNLSDGQKAMLNAYDTYKMPVYKTHRIVGYNDDIVEFSKKNALNTEMIDGGNGVKNVVGVNPFPIPSVGLHLVWNHIMRFRGGSFERVSVQVTPTQSGEYTPIRFFEEFSERYYLRDFEASKDPNVMFYFKQIVTAPARLAGNVLLVHETIDQVKEPRRAWIYNAGQRRVRRAPQVGYDGPGTASDGLRTTDNFDMYNGAPDRYNWELVGKQELYIPYNSYKLDDKSLSYADLVKPAHLDPEHTRYELHRVWKVVGTLKEGMRHIYSKRVLYVDEDTWAAMIADHYDGRGELWRFVEAHNKYFYDAKAVFTTIESSHDLLSGRYLANGLANEEPLRFNFEKTYSSRDFTPAALRRSGKR